MNHDEKRTGSDDFERAGRGLHEHDHEHDGGYKQPFSGSARTFSGKEGTPSFIARERRIFSGGSQIFPGGSS